MSEIACALAETKNRGGLWGATENVTDAARRLRDSGADEVVTTLADAVVQLAKLAPLAKTTLAPIPDDLVGASVRRTVCAMRAVTNVAVGLAGCGWSWLLHGFLCGRSPKELIGFNVDGESKQRAKILLVTTLETVSV